MSQYTGSFDTDACAGNKCGPAFAAETSLPQGQQFAEMTKDFHGGTRKSTRKGKGTRKSSRKGNRRAMRGGSADYPNSFQELLPQEMHGAANIGSQDAAFAQLPNFVGKYGMTGGKRSRKMRRMRGGVSPVDAPSMILTPAEEPAAFLNPQWYNENQVVPSFKGPENAYAAQQYATQFAYNQKAGRRSRKTRTQRKKSTRSSRT